MGKRAKQCCRLGLAVLIGWCATGLVGPDVGTASSRTAISSDDAPAADTPVFAAKKKKKKPKQAPASESAPVPPISSNSSAQADGQSTTEVAVPRPPRAVARVGGDPFLIRVATGLTSPVFITHAGDNSGRLFIVEQSGAIKILQPTGQIQATPFLNVQSKLNSFAGEQGLLGLAFHPNYEGPGAGAGQFFIYYTAPPPAPDTSFPIRDVLARYSVSADPNIANTAETRLMSIPDFAGNHNAGMLAFRNGLLYVATGDGGGGGDNDPAAVPTGNGQRTDKLLGKILRVDVNGTGAGDFGTYSIPPGNPGVPVVPAGTTPRPEIWDYGFRNPWRFSFDKTMGHMYIGDVGQNRVEEIDFEDAAAGGGFNYGWRVKEGSECFNTANFNQPLSPPCPAGGTEVLPVFQYLHSGGNCSVTGGYVYRGTRYPSLNGSYLYGDACTGIIWKLQQSGGGWSNSQFMTAPPTLSSFGEDAAGELYAVSLPGSIYRIADPGCAPRPNIQVAAVAGVPGTLNASATALTNTSTPDNLLFTINFTQLDNAVVDINGSNNHTTPFSLDLGGTSAGVSFTVRRPQPPVSGLATTVRFTVTDACGDWPSFVGGGFGSF